MDRVEFGKTMLSLAAAFDRELTRERIEIDFKAYGHFPDDAVKAAVARAILEHAYPTLPPTALLLRFADESIHGAEMTFDQALTLVWSACREFGDGSAQGKRDARAKLGPKIMQAVDACGGFGRFSDTGADGKGTLIAQFRSSWEGRVKREEQERRLPAALLPRPSDATHQPRIETPATPRLVAQGVNS